MSKLIARLLVSLKLAKQNDPIIETLTSEEKGAIINVSTYGALMLLSIILHATRVYPSIITYILSIILVPALITALIRLFFTKQIIKKDDKDDNKPAFLVKKYSYVDINKRYKPTFMALGFIFVFGFLFLVINWREIEEKTISSLSEFVDIEDNENEAPITQHQPPPPPPPVVEIKAVPEEELIEEVEIEEVEMEEEEEVEEVFEEEPEEEEEEVFMIVEDMPQFPGGGQAALMKYIVENMEYPQMAIDNDVEGTVLVKFTVNKDGSIDDVSVQRGIGAGCDEAATEVIESMPSWSPGKQRGKAVKVSMVIPVRFKIS
jgi:protein TonB